MLRALGLAALLMLLPAFALAQALQVLTAGAMKQVVLALAPAFEAQAGLKVEVRSDTAGGLVKRIQGGEAFDVVLLPAPSLDALTKEGKVDAASTRPVAKVGIGFAVRQGSPSPPLESVEQFKAALLGARRVAYIDPASGGSSGIYLDRLFQRLGIAEAMRAKAVLVAGGLAADRVVDGEADVALQQISEIVPVAGVTLAGPLPESIQNYTTYAGGTAAATGRAAAARSFLAALAGPQADGVIREKGLMPAR
jgi:molybdate transport system substrate-binding protein